MSSLVGSGLATPALATSGSTFVLEQNGTEIPLTPLSYDGQSIEEFYGMGPHEGNDYEVDTTTGIERSNVSNVFLYEDPDGSTSLVIIHDGRIDSSGGAATFEFTGLPRDGRWAIKDDLSADDFANAPDRIEWEWNDCCGDGGAYRDLELTGGGVPFANQLKIRPGGSSDAIPLSNPWHYAEKFDRSIEGLEPPVWVLVFADNADFDTQPAGNLPRPFSIENGEVVLDTQGTEPTNDVFLLLKPAQKESNLQFVDERASRDNQILFEDEILIQNTNNVNYGQTFSLPGTNSTSVTITPDFKSGISEWQALSGDASNPDRHTLDMNQPVTIRSKKSPPDTGIDTLEGLLGKKDQQIQSLKDIASPPVPESVVDARADEFVSSVRNEYQDFDETTRTQHEEALKRLVAAEEVTETMASAPREDPDADGEIIPEMGEGITSAAIILASRGLEKLGGKLGGLKIFGKIKRFIVKRVQRYAQSTLGALASKGVINTRTANKILTRADLAASRLRTLFESDVTGDDLKSASETAAEGGLKKVYDETAPKSVKDETEGIRETIDSVFADVMYTYYFANTDVAEVALPSPDDFTLPEGTFEFTVDLPDEHLPDIPFVDEPDKITVDADIDPELPNAPEFDTIDKIEDALDLVSTGLSGLDPTLDDELEDLIDKVESGELNAQDPQTRRNLKSLVIDGTESLTDIAESLVSKVEGVAKQAELERITLYIAGLMVLAAVLIATGIGVPTAIGVLIALGKLAGYLAIISTAVTLTPLVVGGGYLTALDKAHLLETKALLNTDLQEVSL